MKYEEFERTLLEKIDQLEDCLRVHRLTEPTKQYVKEYGKFKVIDLDGRWWFKRARANSWLPPKPVWFAQCTP
jgi:hypothetical protein